MALFNLQYKDITRYQIQPENRNSRNFYLTSNSQIEIFCKNILIQNIDTVTINFEKPFTGIPTAIAGFVSDISNENPGINVYIESVSKNSVTVRLSSNVESAEISVHAMYFGS